MQRGFIQIPILIAVIFSLTVLGSGGYLMAHKIKNPVPVDTIDTPVTTSAPQTNSTTKDDEKNSVINTLQKEVDDLKNKVNQLKTIERTPAITNNPQKDVVIEQTAPAPQIATNTFACSKFSSLKEDIYGILIHLIDMSQDDGTAENPSKDNFDYPYNKVNAQKTAFYTNITRLNQKIDMLDAYEGVSRAKSYISQAASNFQGAFDLKLQGFKLVNNDAFVYVSGIKMLPRDNTDQAKLNINQAYSKFTSALDFSDKGKDVLDSTLQLNSCN